MRTEDSRTSVRSRRVRNALLASALTVGIAGFAASGAVVSDIRHAFAEPVRVEAPAPADFTALVEQVKPAVVSVRVRSERAPVAFRGPDRGPRGQDRDGDWLPPGFRDLPEDHPFRDFFRRFGPPGDEMPQPPRRGMGQGSGFFISADGFVVTNHHVVRDALEVTVIMDDGTELEAEVIGSDPRTDLALLKVEGNDFTYVGFAEEPPVIGQWAVAIGNPFGLGGTVTAGIVSADGRDIGAGPYHDFIQVDAPVNRGNSGGPTFNVRGEVIGVNTAIFSPSGGNVGIAFAIPAETAQEVIATLQRTGAVTRGWLGVQIQPVTAEIAESLGLQEAAGALVADPQTGGPAEQAGIRAGDVILQVDGRGVEDPRHLARMIGGYDPDTEVQVTLWRRGEQQAIAVTLGELETDDVRAERPEPAEPTTVEGLGLTLAPNNDGPGVTVTAVEPGSPADERGIQVGDVIVSVGGEEVESLRSVEEQIAAVRNEGRRSVLVQVQGERGTRFVALPVERG